MLATEYYWRKATEALAKADATELRCFMSIAIAYRALALGEDRFRSALPQYPPRRIPTAEPAANQFAEGLEILLTAGEPASPEPAPPAAHAAPRPARPAIQPRKPRRRLRDFI